jgi:hypothetical protein
VLRADRSAGIAQAEPGRKSVSPLKAFALVLSLLAVMIATFLLLRNDTPAPAASPNQNAAAEPTTLTNEEAIARLAEIDVLRLRALEERDPDIISEVIHPTGPALDRLLTSIRQLKSDGVHLEQQVFDVESARVIDRSDSQISIKQVVLTKVRYLDGSGRNLSKGSVLERQVLIATLRREGDDWLFYQGRTISSAPVT